MASTGIQSAVQLALLPLVLYRFDAATVALWALFLSIATIVNTAAQTITATAIRAVAFTAAGARDLADIKEGRKGSSASPPNLELLAHVMAGARASYALLAAIALLLLASVGSLLVERLVAATPDPDASWQAWAIVVAALPISTYGNVFIAYVEGHNQMALTRRWDAIFALLGAISSATVLVVDGGLLALVCATQVWTALRVARNWMLARTVEDQRYRTLPRRPARAAVHALWPAFWRSFLGVAFVVGINHAGAVFYAQLGDPRVVASYLLAVRMLEALSAIARAPFYSRIPALVRMYAQGNLAGEIAAARTGMRLAYWLFVAGLLAAAVVGPPLFAAIGSAVPFPPRLLWLLLGTALLLERYGAMHLQLYSTTNQIVWHAAAAGYAILYVAAIAVLHRAIGVYAMPVAMLLGYAGWYAWFSARRSYRTFELRFWSFERTLFVPPFALALAAVLVVWLTGGL